MKKLKTMVELQLHPYYDNAVSKFEADNNCDAYVWWSEFISWLSTWYHCEYWEREEQFGGPCFIFREDKDLTFFKLQFS